MTRRVNLPDVDLVRQAATDVIAAARAEGRRPTVVALAGRLGMSNATFWRHFPDVARDLVAAARSTESPPAGSDAPNRYDRLADDHSRLKQANAELTRDLARAAAAIQRLALDNHELRQQLAATTGVISLADERRIRRPVDS
jgi:predicted ArsR family transcriptional regulator